LTGDAERLAGLFDRSGATHLLVDGSDPAWPTWRDRPPPLFIVEAAGADWRVLRRDPSRLASTLSDRFSSSAADSAHWTVLPADPLAGEVSFLRIDPVLLAGASALRLVDPSSRRVLVSAPLPSGEAPFALLPPPDTPVGRYDLLLDRPGARALALGDFPVGREYEAESFPLPEALPRAAPDAAWAIYDQRFYSRHRAAWTAANSATTARSIQPLPPGRYTLRARVYEYPTANSNAVKVTFADAAAVFAWSGGSGTPRWLAATAESTTTAATLHLTATRIGQPYAIVDVIRIHPA
jgi:hypothetical protein